MPSSRPAYRIVAAKTLLVAALSTVSAGAWSVAIQVGQPTYFSDSLVDESRGSASPRFIANKIVRGWNGQGSSGVAVFQPVPNQVNATEASGSAEPSQLKSLARATGPTGFADTQSPYAIARNRSETTRYWEFKDPGQATTNFSPLVVGFDGQMRGMAIHELLETASSRLEFGLDLIDGNNSLIGNIFTVGAQLSYTPTSADLWSLLTTESGTAVGTGWASAFTRQARQSPVDYVYDFDYLANMTTPYVVPTDQKVGLRWFLETEGMFTGALVFAADVGVDASNTATFDSAVSPASLSGAASATEILSVPALSVPEPASFALLLGGLVGLRLRRRQVRWRDQAVRAGL